MTYSLQISGPTTTLVYFPDQTTTSYSIVGLQYVLICFNLCFFFFFFQEINKLYSLKIWHMAMDSVECGLEYSHQWTDSVFLQQQHSCGLHPRTPKCSGGYQPR
jgi:hypothetical protein